MSACLPAPEWRQCQLIELAQQHGTPLYIYDLECLSQTLERMWSILWPSRGILYFATMANDRHPVLNCISGAGLGACVNSIPHLQMALECGFELSRIQFTSTGITAGDMRILRQHDVRTNIDSLAQLEQWAAAGGKTAGLRINAASLSGESSGDRIGISASDLPVALSAASRLGIQITGIHVYVGTNFQQPQDMFPTLDAFFALARSVPALRYLNIGGGIGVDYSCSGEAFDLDVFGTYLARRISDLRSHSGEDIDLILEPGRSLAAACGSYIVQVTDTKELNGHRYVAVDGSIAQFPRPFHHPENPHRLTFMPANGTPFYESDQALIVGRTTFSRDILGRAAVPADARMGDYVMIGNAGAYSQSMASRFLGQPEPKELYLNEPLLREVAAE